MPSRAKIKMNRDKSKSRLAIDLMLFTNDSTRLLSDSQYRVTLKIRSSRIQRSTLIPMGLIPVGRVMAISKRLLNTTYVGVWVCDRCEKNYI